MKQKGRIINLRLFFIGFIGMILGILFFYNLLNIFWLNKVTAWFIFLGIIFVAVGGCSVWLILNKKYKKFFKYSITFVVLFVVAFGLFGVRVNQILKYPTFDDEKQISGIVTSNYFKKNYYYITLSNLKINNVKTDGKMNVFVTITSSIPNNLSLGDEIKFIGEISKTELVTDKIEIAKFVDDDVYFSSVVSSEMQVVDKKPNIIFSLQNSLRNALDSGLLHENSAIAFGTLVGDKNAISEQVLNTFSFAGISHIIAVSGLHVGFLVGLLTLILNLFKVGRKNRFFIISSILMFYCVFCNMSASILRATIMTIVLLLAGVLGEEYDGLNALGVSGIFILLLFPLQLFSLGFQLSFMCVFIIITLADKLTRILKGWRIPENIASAISISLCVTIGTSIICANTMQNVSLISIISNLIVIPLFSFTYPLLFVCAIIAMILPIGKIMLFIPNILIHAIKNIANFFNGINFAHFRIYNLGYLILLVFVLFALVCKFLMVEKPIKCGISAVLGVMFIVLFVIGVVPNKFNSYSLITNYQYKTNSAVLTCENNKKYLVGYNNYNTLRFLTELKIDSINGWVLQEFEVNKIDEYIEILKEVKFDKLIIPRKSEYVAKVFINLSKYVDVLLVDNYNTDVGVEFVKTDNVVAGTIITINNKTILFVNGNLTLNKLDVLNSAIVEPVDYVFANSFKYNLESFGVPYKTLIACNTSDTELNEIILLKNKSCFKLNLE